MNLSCQIYCYTSVILSAGSFFPSSIHAQEPLSRQVLIVTENDGMISADNDGYYTNGVSISYQWYLHRPEKRNANRVQALRMGQNIYTSRFSGEPRKENLDRPITGYLFADYHQKLYNEKERLLQWGIGVGVVGPHAFGKEVQSFVHRVVQIYKPAYWELQLQNAFGFTADITWSPQIGKPNIHPHLELKPQLSATAGNLFNHIGIGGALIYGKIHSNSTSAFWYNHRGFGKQDRELFLYLYPVLYLKAYDATVQGGMFKRSPEAIEGKLNPLFLNSRCGIMYAGNKFNLGASFVYESRQSLTQKSPQVYGSIQAALLW